MTNSEGPLYSDSDTEIIKKELKVSDETAVVDSAKFQTEVPKS